MEVIVYQASWARWNRTSGVLAKAARLLVFIGLALILFSYAPDIWYSALAKVEVNISNFTLSGKEVQLLNSRGKPIIEGHTTITEYIPPFDPTLPVSNRLVIPSIGVGTDIQEATYDNYEAALKKGVWRVSNFGSPNDTSMPIILAAHRFGYLAWTNSYRRTNSFYNLPEVQAGDTIEVDWRQRKYTYEVYSVANDTEIKDYTADLILYTCESLTGPDRVFVYAKLLRV